MKNAFFAALTVVTCSLTALAAAPYSMTVNVNVGCKSRIQPVPVTNFTQVGIQGDQLQYRGQGSVPHKCGSNGTVTATVDLLVPSSSLVQGDGGFLGVGSLISQTTCSGSTNWAPLSTCVGINPPGPAPLPPPPQSMVPGPTQVPLAVTVNVAVGCENRLQPITITNLVVSQDLVTTKVFRGSAVVPHKCDGDKKTVTGQVQVTIPTVNSYVNAQGILYSPATNAGITCTGFSDWLPAGSACSVTNVQ